MNTTGFLLFIVEMIKILYLIIGGGIGTLLRFWVSSATGKLIENGFPVGTLMVNLLGCLIIGIVGGLNSDNSFSENTRLLVITGLLGGFTTFSSFSMETVQLFRNGQALWAIGYVLLSNIGGIMLAMGGFYLFRKA